MLINVQRRELQNINIALYDLLLNIIIGILGFFYLLKDFLFFILAFWFLKNRFDITVMVDWA